MSNSNENTFDGNNINANPNGWGPISIASLLLVALSVVGGLVYYLKPSGQASNDDTTTSNPSPAARRPTAPLPTSTPDSASPSNTRNDNATDPIPNNNNNTPNEPPKSGGSRPSLLGVSDTSLYRNLSFGLVISGAAGILYNIAYSGTTTHLSPMNLLCYGMLFLGSLSASNLTTTEPNSMKKDSTDG
jgi:hypothetical protein